MILLEILSVIIQVFAVLYLLADMVSTIRNLRLQKEWDSERDMRLRSNPKISRAELCEYYVMFCKRNCCNVEFDYE